MAIFDEKVDVELWLVGPKRPALRSLEGRKTGPLAGECRLVERSVLQ